MNTKFANMLFSTSHKVQFCLLFDRFLIASITSAKNLIQHAFLTFYTQDSCCVIRYNLEGCLLGEKKKQLRSKHLFYSVSRKCIEECEEEDGEEEDGHDLQDGELVVVPDDVPEHDGLHHL